MTGNNSTPRRKKTNGGLSQRPTGFPLFKHASGQWAKKVRGKLFYFGVDQQAALDRWLADKDDLLAGRTPRRNDPSAMTVMDAAELFLQSRQRLVDTGELSQQTLSKYLSVVEPAIKSLGGNTNVEQLRPDDFQRLRTALSKGCNLKTLEGRIAAIRAMFNHIDKNGLLDTSLNKLWGTEFKKPGRVAITKLSNQTSRFLEALEIQKLLTVAGVPMRAMILLGINCGFGNTDVARLRFNCVDFENGFIELDRSKTGKLRRCPLWPVTAEAIQAAIGKRSTPKSPDDAELIFVTKRGGNWIPCEKDNPVSKEFAKVRTAAGITGRGKSFYSLRHSFQTIGDEVRDFVAVSSIMGHSASSISDHYRERIGDDRLQVVSDHVRKWLFGLEVVE